MKKAKALHLAVSAIYFADSSDYYNYLWEIVNTLNPKIAKLLEEDEEAAYRKTGEAVGEIVD